jgi:hypothetical protein
VGSKKVSAAPRLFDARHCNIILILCVLYRLADMSREGKEKQRRKGSRTGRLDRSGRLFASQDLGLGFSGVKVEARRRRGEKADRSLLGGGAGFGRRKEGRGIVGENFTAGRNRGCEHISG